MNKVLVLLGCLLVSPAFAQTGSISIQAMPPGTSTITSLSVDDTSCSTDNNYAAQYKVKELLNKGLFEFDGMTWKQLGNEHWFITKRLYPWSEGIKDYCLKNEVQGYLRTELDYLQDYVVDQKKPPEARQQDDGTYQNLGMKKKESFAWPKVP